MPDTASNQLSADNTLWLLLPVKGDVLWKPWYDKAFGFVVCAPDQDTARRLASEEAGDEGKAAWLSSAHTTCSWLGQGTHSITHCVVLKDFASA